MINIITNPSAAKVVKFFDDLEEAIGIEAFQELIPVILTDRDPSFADIDGICFSKITGEERCKLFFCDPYVSNQKPNVENMNKQIRLFFPKGKSIDKLTKTDVKNINKILLDKPLRSLDGNTPKETFIKIYDDDLLVDYGVFESTLDDEVKRIVELKHWFISMVNQLDPDYIGIEGIQYQQQFGVVTFQTLARVQGALMCACVEMDLPYEVCPTNTWRHYCGVKGRSRVDRKRSMQNLVKSWYDVSVSDDEADAVGIGRYVSQCIVPKNDIVEWE